jgi:hypothetical protein
MPLKLSSFIAALLVCASTIAQEAPEQPARDVWSWAHRVEIRANYRWSDHERFNRPFPPGAAIETVDPGSHVELNVADVQLELGYGDWLTARARVHAQAKHRRNPTSTDQQVDADELWVRLGPKPEFLARPAGTSFFVQAGKFPKMERQPLRLLESYGLVTTAFNRFEDVQVQVGGTIGRNFYWRAQAANGNPLFIRDANALAGDNGTPGEILRGETPDLHSGFPILYNAETEDLFFDTSHVQLGEALGYRWQRENETLGFDLIAFHYRRSMADTVKLTGTIYGGDLDILLVDEVPGEPPRGLPFTGDTKEEYGARLYGEWDNWTSTVQFTHQNVAGLERDGWEAEVGYRFAVALGLLESFEPAVRVSSIDNHFLSHPQFPAVSARWDWTKFDGGVRVGLKHGLDVTLEYTTHQIRSTPILHQREALVTVRWRI